MVACGAEIRTCSKAIPLGGFEESKELGNEAMI